MLGLRTQETNKFNAFFEIVQKKASEKNCVFFLDSGDGNEFENESMEGETLQGWLVPKTKAEEFGKVWLNNEEDDEWAEFFCWAEWSVKKGNIDVTFSMEN